MASRSFVICLDESQESARAWTWAFQNVLRSGDNVVLLTVAVLDTTNISDYSMLALAADDIAPAGSLDEAALETARKATMEANEAFMNRMLSNAEADAKTVGLNIHLEGKVLTQNGSVGETIVAFLNSGRLGKDVTAVVCGSRGLGAFKRAMLGAIGMGSASDHLCHNLHIPVIVVREPSSSEEHYKRA